MHVAIKPTLPVVSPRAEQKKLQGNEQQQAKQQ